MTSLGFTRSVKKSLVYRFTRALFRRNQSPFILGGTLQQHHSSQEGEFPLQLAEIKDGLFVDALLSEVCVLEKVQHFKETAIEIFDRAEFKLHKWHSNVGDFKEVTNRAAEQTTSRVMQNSS